MSIEIMNEVWKHAPVDQGTLLVLLALADSADERSRMCYPGINETLAPKTRLSPRQVKRCLSDLAANGIISVRRNASPLKTNLYQIAPAHAWRSDIMSPPSEKPEVPLCHLRGDAHVTSEVTPMSPKPSVTSVTEDSNESSSDLFSANSIPEKQKLPTGKKTRPKRKSRMSEDAVISDAQIRAARKRGHSLQEAEAQFQKFKNDALAKGKLFLDWDRAFVTWLDSEFFRPLVDKIPNGSGGPRNAQSADESTADFARRIAERRAARRMDCGPGEGASLPLLPAEHATGPGRSGNG